LEIWWRITLREYQKPRKKGKKRIKEEGEEES
jgi:hypothetical protein